MPKDEEQTKNLIKEYFSLKDVIYNFPEGKAKMGILFLAGRGIPAEDTMSWAKLMGIQDALLVTAQTHQVAWYPAPNGANDQEYALLGIDNAVQNANKIIRSMNDAYEIPFEKIIVMGFSAGAVVAIQTVSRSEVALGGAIAYAGAILDPDSLPECRFPKMPILLRHNEDDDCFEWEERYLPMKKALRDKGYKLSVSESLFGGHRPALKDFLLFGNWIKSQLKTLR